MFENKSFKINDSPNRRSKSPERIVFNQKSECSIEIELELVPSIMNPEAFLESKK